MVRYSYTQTFTDVNTHVIPQNQSQSTTTATTATSSSSSEAVPTPSTANDIKPKKLIVEKVTLISGSCRGAGSGEFHTYRHGRRRELTRLEEIEKNQIQTAKQMEFATKIAKNKFETELRTVKNSKKRKKLKEKKLQRKRKYLEMKKIEGQNGKSSNEDDDESDEDENDDENDDGDDSENDNDNERDEKTNEAIASSSSLSTTITCKDETIPQSSDPEHQPSSTSIEVGDNVS